MWRRTARFFMVSVVTVAALPSQVFGQDAVERHVMAFYYPWYGVPEGPGGAGKVVHWGKIDAANHDIAASTHYPLLGAYDSHDPQVIDQHCQWAKAAHIDTFIVPKRFEFPTSGDLRWRPFYDQNHAEYVLLLQLRTRAGDNLGDGVAYARLSTGGHVAYAWFGLLNTPQAEPLLYDLFTFLAARLGQ